MKKHYPENYTGPKAGISSDEEWLAVRGYDAFKFIRSEIWSYSDFDCWLGARSDYFYDLGKSNKYVR